jgi:branched-chain amino acid transport system ATP-binding protein
VITFHDLTVRFGGVRPLSELELELDGSIVGIVGPNGAGKTTLLNVLSGFVELHTGRVLVDSVDITPMRPYERARWGIRRTFQTEQVAESATVYDNVAVILDSMRMARTQRREAVATALEVTGLTGKAHHHAVGLNSFERRLVEIARAIAGTPRVIMMDEPAAGLSEVESNKFRDLVVSLPSLTGAMVVLIDHDVDLIASVCEKTAVLDFGRLIAYGPTAEVLENPDVKAAYLGTAEELEE